MQIGIVIVGLGRHGSSIARLARAAGAAVVGAVDPHHAGRDLAAVCGDDGLAGVGVVASLRDLDVLDGAAQVVVHAAAVDPAGVVDAALEAFERGWDFITIVETVYDITSLAPHDAQRLEYGALAAGRTFLATGGQDISWSGLAVHATGMVRDLREIELLLTLGVDGYPASFLESLGIGADAPGFAVARQGLYDEPPVLGSIVPGFARALGLDLSPVVRRDIEPFRADEDITSATFGRTIAAGEIAGMVDRTVYTTAEGIVITTQLTTTAHPPGDRDVYVNVLHADPRVELTQLLFPSPATVDATTVNRIPDVIAAPAGVQWASMLPMPVYRHRLSRD